MKTSYAAIFALTALSLVACGKKGSVSGSVIDPFTGKKVELPTVFVKNTPFTSQKIKGGLPTGDYKFEKIEPGTYTLSAGKARYSKTNVEFTISETALDAKLDLYIFSKEGLNPGMYRPVAGAAAEKIANDWVSSEVSCKESIVALRPKFTQLNDKKEKITIDLAAPKKMDASLNVLYYNASSVSSPIEAVAYPVVEEKSTTHADCAGINVAKEPTLVVPQKDKGVKLSSAYKSENLYEITGTLPKGKQIITLHQDGKLLKSYYFEVK